MYSFRIYLSQPTELFSHRMNQLQPRCNEFSMFTENLKYNDAMHFQGFGLIAWFFYTSEDLSDKLYIAILEWSLPKVIVWEVIAHFANWLLF